VAGRSRRRAGPATEARRIQQRGGGGSGEPAACSRRNGTCRDGAPWQIAERSLPAFAVPFRTSLATPLDCRGRSDDDVRRPSSTPPFPAGEPRLDLLEQPSVGIGIAKRGVTPFPNDTEQAERRRHLDDPKVLAPDDAGVKPPPEALVKGVRPVDIASGRPAPPCPSAYARAGGYGTFASCSASAASWLRKYLSTIARNPHFRSRKFPTLCRHGSVGELVHVRALGLLCGPAGCGERVG